MQKKAGLNPLATAQPLHLRGYCVCVCVCVCVRARARVLATGTHPQNRKERSIDTGKGDTCYSWLISVWHQIMRPPLLQEVYYVYHYICRLPTATYFRISATHHIRSLCFMINTGFVLLSFVLKIRWKVKYDIFWNRHGNLINSQSRT